MAKQLYPSVLDMVKKDPDLLAIVSKEMDVDPESVIRAANRNSNTINKYSVVKAIADYLGKKPEDIVVEESNGDVNVESKKQIVNTHV